MSRHLKAWQILDHDVAVIREIISASQAVVADLSGNADDRQRGGYILVDANRMRRLIAAVDALDTIGQEREER